MPGVFEYLHTVGPEAVDQLGHVNNVAYVDWMQLAALAHSAAQGWPGERYQAAGYGWVVRTHKIEYRQPAFAEDKIVVETWVATMKKATSVRRYHIFRQTDEVLLAEAETKWAFIDYDTGRLMRIPREVAEAFEVVDKRGKRR